MVNAGLPPVYVLDEIEPFEVQTILTQIENNYKNSWEQTRQICYILAQVNSSKQLTPQDVLHFSWDTIEKQELTPEQLQAAKQDLINAANNYLNGNVKKYEPLK